MLAALVTWWAAASAGDALAMRFAGRLDERLRWPVASAAGFALIGSVVAVLALLHASSGIAVALVPVAVLALAWRSTIVRVPGALALALRRTVGMPVIDRALIALAGSAALTSAVAAALPAVWWDPIAYHLPILAASLHANTLAYDPGMPQTAFPLLAECAVLPAYALAGASGAAMAILGSGIVLAWLSGAIAATYAPRSFALTVALVASTPLWLWLAPSFYVDIPFALFAVAALALPLSADGPRSSGAALVIGSLAGCAAAVKLTGLGVGFVCLAFVLWQARGYRGRAAISFAGGFLVLAGGWYLRSFILTGDALYPFLTSLGADAPAHAFAVRYAAMTEHWCGGGSSIGDLVALPWRMLVDPRQYCGDPGYALRLGAVLFVAGLAVWRSTRRLELAALALTLLWFFESRQDRFIVPALCVFAMSVAVALWALPLREATRTAVTIALGCLGAVAVAASWLPALAGLSANSLVPSFAFIAGQETAEQLLGDRLESYDAMRWTLERVRPGERVLALDDVRDYYLDGRAVWANPYYQPIWDIDWSAPPRARWDPVARAGFRFVVVNLNPAYLARTPTGLEAGVLRQDVAAGVLREDFASNDVAVFTVLVPPAERSRG